MKNKTKNNGRSKAEALAEYLIGKDKLLIYSHNDPDPDSMAAAVGLREIVRKITGVKAPIAYGGFISRAENKTMARLLSLDLKHISKIDQRHYSCFALLDSQPGAGNTPFSGKRLPNIVIDHHRPIRRKTYQADFSDIRTDYGATSTILVEYLTELGISLSSRVATALSYGISSDISGVYHNPNPADIKALSLLLPHVNHKKLTRIENPRLTNAYFTKVAQTLSDALIYRDAITCRMNKVEGPEIVAEMADELLRLDGMKWAFTVGIDGRSMVFSIRTLKKGRSISRIAARLSAPEGSGGGSINRAAGRIPLKPGADPKRKMDLLIDAFLAMIDLAGSESSPLI